MSVTDGSAGSDPQNRLQSTATLDTVISQRTASSRSKARRQESLKISHLDFLDVDVSETVVNRGIFTRSASSTEVPPIPASVPTWVVKTADGWKPLKKRDQKIVENGYQDGQEIIGVECGRYDVHIKERTIVPVYWNGEEREIIRGTFFYCYNFGELDMERIPVPEVEAESLEKVYNKVFKLWGRLPVDAFVRLESEYDESVDDTSLISVTLSEADDLNTEFTEWDGSAIKEPVIMQMSNETGYFASGLFSSEAPPLRRGFGNYEVEGEAVEEHFKDKPVGCVIFVLHGMGEARSRKNFDGQNYPLGQNTNVNDDGYTRFRQGVDLHRLHMLRNLQAHESPFKMELIPVEWYDFVHGSDSNPENESRLRQNLDGIQLPTVSSARDFFNLAVVDYLVYSDPVWNQKIQDYLLQQILSTYILFSERTPNFLGSTSIIAHSLGAVLAYDMLQNEFMEKIAKYEMKQKMPMPTCLFVLGSPLGLFLSVKETREDGDSDTIMESSLMKPRQFTLFNIFHPDDVIAYRLEPLVNYKYRDEVPLVVPYQGGLRLHYSMKQNFQSISSVWGGGIQGMFANTEQKETPRGDRRPSATDPRTEELIAMDKDKNIRHLQRLDYQLQETPVEALNEILSATTSHFQYWENADVVDFYTQKIVEAVDHLRDHYA